MQKQAFIDKITPYAVLDMSRTGVLASITVAQAILESGWGDNAPGNNLFGVKAKKGQGQLLWTTEEVNGKKKRVQDWFKVYNNWGESLADHSATLMHARYKAVIGQKDFRKAAQALEDAGYATDSSYSELLTNIITSNSLTKYDTGTYKGLTMEGVAAATGSSKYDINKPVMGAFQDYWNENFQKSRGSFDPYKIRIGDVVTNIPPEMIQVDHVNNLNTFNVIRQKQSIKTKNGSAMTQISMTFYFNGEEEINGYAMVAPEGGFYWMDGLRAMIAQFKRMPFLPVENEFLNRTCDIYALAFSSVTVRTMDEFPGLLCADCVFYEFDIAAYTGFPSFTYDGMIMWPLFRWYYQQMLNPAGVSTTKLEAVPIPLEQTAEFYILDEEFLTANRNTLKNKTKEEVYKLVEMDGDYVITSFSATFGNLLTPIVLDQIGAPTFQFFGGLDTKMSLGISTSNADVVMTFRQMADILEHYSRTYRNRYVSGYLKVRNALVNMMGITYTMIESISIATMPGLPGEYAIEIVLVSFDETQMDGERLKGYNGFDINVGGDPGPGSLGPGIDQLAGVNPANFQNVIIQEVRAEKFLNSLELYPDLELPNYETVNTMLTLIAAQRKKGNLIPLPISTLPKVHPQAAYVDPDFYIIYPDLSSYFSGGEFDVLGGGIAQRLGDMKYQVTHSREDGQKREVNTNANKYLAPETSMQEWNGLKKATLETNYYTDAWTYKKDSKGNYLPENYHVEWITTQPKTEALKKMMCYDAFFYSKRGSMLRAFPSFVLMLIDEGQWVNTRKIWDNYYTYHAVSNLSVVRDRRNPVDVAYVTMSNVYGSLNYQTAPPYRKSDSERAGANAVELGAVSIRESWNFFFPNLEGEREKGKFLERANLLDAGYLNAGARVHIRMGYGSVASTMPITFNGVITEVDAQDEMNIICQGDGAELLNEIQANANELNFELDEGDDGQALIQHFMTIRQHQWIFNNTRGLNANLGMMSKFGIEHFGYVRQLEEATFWDFMFRTVTFGQFSSMNVDPNHKRFLFRSNMDGYDVIKNIYSTIAADATTGTTGQNNPEIVNTFLYKKSPWDIVKLMARIHTDYIAATTYHNFHSTLFFGQPQWLCKQGWSQRPNTKGDNINDYQDLTKPYAQIHFLSSMEDVIHNGIKASGTDLITHSAAMFYEGKNDSTPILGPDVWADQRIRPDLQRTRMMDSTIVQSYLWNVLWQAPFQGRLFGFIPSIVQMRDYTGSVFNQFNHFMQKQTYDFHVWLTGSRIPEEAWVTAVQNMKYDRLTRGKQQAMAFSISTIAESFKDMYQGSLMILGDAAIKPYDFIYLTDSYTQMHGTIEVKRVIHHMGFDTGFITDIMPDLVVAQVHAETYYDDALISDKARAIEQCTRAGALFVTFAARRMISWTTLRTLNRVGRKLNLLKGTKLITGTGNLARESFSLLRVLPGFSKLGSFVSTARASLTAARTTVMGGTAAVGGTVVLAPEAIVSLIIEAAVFAMVDVWTTDLLDWLNHDHHCIQIFPLFYKGHPYIAGINGHMNLIPGWKDDFIYGNPNYTAEGDLIQPGTIGYPGSAGTTGTLNQLPTSYTSMPAVENRVILPVNISWSDLVGTKNGPAGVAGRFGPVNRTTGNSAGQQWHNGYDFPGSSGGAHQSIYALADGYIVDAQTANKSYGKVIVIRHKFSDGGYYYTLYGHMSELIVSNGTVKSGQLIGKMGNTGLSDGAHLHLGLFLANGKPKDATSLKLSDLLYYTSEAMHNSANYVNGTWLDPWAFLLTNNANGPV